MNIFYVSSLYPPYIVGGAELIASYLAECVADRGHSVTVLTTESPTRSHGFSEAWQGGVRVLRVAPLHVYWLYEKRRRRSPLLKVFWHIWERWNVTAGKLMATALERSRPDIVHTHNIAGLSPIVWSRAQHRQIPLIHTAHDYYLACPRTTLLKSGGELCEVAPLHCQAYRKLNTLAGAAVDVFAAPSLHLLERHRQLGIQARQWRIIRNGVPIADQEEHRASGSARGLLRLLFVGQLDTHKGIDVLLASLRELPRAPLTLTVAGRGPLASLVGSAAREDPRINYVGFVSGTTKMQVFRESDALVFPSVWEENAPTTILEAYAYGMPVIASRIGGLPELVRDGDTGLLFSPGDALALARVIAGFLASPGLLERLRDGVRQVRDSHRVERMTDEYLHVYAELLDAGRRGSAVVAQP